MAERELYGTLVNACKFTGTLTPFATLNGSLALGVGISGAYARYTGEYTVTPKATKQTLETKKKALDDNVTVLEIPYAEVENSKGGLTISIAS